MYLVENKEKAMKLLKTDWLLNQNIVGYLKSIPECKLYVDDLENPQGILLDAGFWQVAYADTQEGMEKVAVMAETIAAQNPKRYLAYSGVTVPMAERLQRGKKIDWENRCDIYHYPGGVDAIPEIPHKLESLKEEDAEIVDLYYTYRNKFSLQYIKACIQNRPSSVIRDEAGKPVSWALVHEDNSMGIMYTLEAYRQKKLAVSVTLDLIKKVIQWGGIPFCHIVTDNFNSQKLAQKCGMIRYKEISWFAIEKTIGDE